MQAQLTTCRCSKATTVGKKYGGLGGPGLHRLCCASAQAKKGVHTLDVTGMQCLNLPHWRLMDCYMLCGGQANLKVPQGDRLQGRVYLLSLRELAKLSCTSEWGGAPYCLMAMDDRQGILSLLGETCTSLALRSPSAC